MEGEWKPLDSYINDRHFYKGALQRLRERRGIAGFSIYEAEGGSSCDFNFGEIGFVQMGAVLEDHGVWNDYSDYLSSQKYSGMNRVQLTLYPLIAWMSNRNIEKIRCEGIEQR